MGRRGETFGAAIFLVALVAARRRRGLLAGFLGLAIAGCSSAEGEREAQTTSGPTVKIVDPIPTYDLGQLRLVIPKEGRTLTVTVTPDVEIEQVEVRVLDPEATVFRLGHGPWLLEVPGWVAQAEGGRTVCVTAVDAHARTGEVCFLAVAG